MKKAIITTLVSLLALWSARAQHIELPATYGDGMVLQRGMPLRLGGKTDAGLRVEVSLGNVKATAIADHQGRFEAILPAQKAGGPYVLTFATGMKIRAFANVYIGEVWLCSGQSNMEFRVREASTAQEDLKTANTLARVHLYNMESAWPLYATKWDEAKADSADRGLFIKPGKWTKCSTNSARNFSAIGFHFARILADSLKCHVGILSNAVGGATTEGWIDSTSLAVSVPEMLRGDWRKNECIMEWARKRADFNLQNLQGSEHSHPYAPGYLYHAAIRPIAGYPLRGILWYQGESNADLVKMHERLFPLLESSWRNAWKNPKLPFYFVQLSSISTRPTWPEFRNSQRLMGRALPHTYMAVSSDVGDSLDVHPRQKRIVAERLAAAALHHTYGFARVVPGGPEPQSAQAESGGWVRVHFSQAAGLQFASEPQPAFFELAGNDGTYYPATEALIEGPSVKLRSPQVARPCKVRYGWQPFTRANLVNGASMPCSTFELNL